VHTDMEMWTEIRRKVLVDAASKRSIRRDYRISAEALEKILAHPELPDEGRPNRVGRLARMTADTWPGGSEERTARIRGDTRTLG